VTAQQQLDVGRTAAGQKLLHMETLLMLTVAENGKQCPAGQSLVQSSCGCCGQEEFFAIPKGQFQFRNVIPALEL